MSSNSHRNMSNCLFMYVSRVSFRMLCFWLLLYISIASRIRSLRIINSSICHNWEWWEGGGSQGGGSLFGWNGKISQHTDRAKLASYTKAIHNQTLVLIKLSGCGLLTELNFISKVGNYFSIYIREFVEWEWKENRFETDAESSVVGDKTTRHMNRWWNVRRMWISISWHIQSACHLFLLI